MIDFEYSIDQKPEVILLSTPLSTPVYARLRRSTPDLPPPTWPTREPPRPQITQSEISVYGSSTLGLRKKWLPILEIPPPG